MMKTGIIFDLDGTLWDACEVITESWNIYLDNEAAQWDLHVTLDDLYRACGMTMEAIGDMLFPQVPEKERDQIMDGLCTFEVEYLSERSGNIYPQAQEVLTLLSKQYHVYMVSNCQIGYIEDFLKHSRLGEVVEDFENYGRTGMDKPENIRLLVDRAKLDRAVYVGDTAKDEISSKQAGVGFIHAAYGFGQVEDEVPSIRSLSELPEVLSSLLEPSDDLK